MKGGVTAADRCGEQQGTHIHMCVGMVCKALPIAAEWTPVG